MTATFPVMEVFGPTIQGEGPLAGRLSHFVRFGACDFRCLWCDSLHAVIPEQVKANAVKMEPWEIARRVRDLTPSAPWVTLSGGNPALHELGPVVELLHADGHKVAVETQGTFFKDWMLKVDMLIVSPKPPSSGMDTLRAARQYVQFLEGCESMLDTRVAFKGVVFTAADYEWQAHLMRGLHDAGCPHLYLSAGTDPFHGESLKDTRNGVGTNYKRLCEWVINDPLIPETVRVLPQLHVMAWGHARLV